MDKLTVNNVTLPSWRYWIGQLTVSVVTIMVSKFGSNSAKILQLATTADGRIYRVLCCKKCLFPQLVKGRICLLCQQELVYVTLQFRVEAIHAVGTHM